MLSTVIRLSCALAFAAGLAEASVIRAVVPSGMDDTYTSNFRLQIFLETTRPDDPYSDFTAINLIGSDWKVTGFVSFESNPGAEKMTIDTVYEHTTHPHQGEALSKITQRDVILASEADFPEVNGVPQPVGALNDYLMFTVFQPHIVSVDQHKDFYSGQASGIVDQATNRAAPYSIFTSVTLTYESEHPRSGTPPVPAPPGFALLASLFGAGLLASWRRRVSHRAPDQRQAAV